MAARKVAKKTVKTMTYEEKVKELKQQQENLRQDYDKNLTEIRDKIEVLQNDKRREQLTFMYKNVDLLIKFAEIDQDKDTVERLQHFKKNGVESYVDDYTDITVTVGVN